ncbi:hypothetical protein NNC19_13640 [Clostridium sp. SHJSY1]|uniref:hypothetical protein n=1 Tax=Clostridium sp. SHJSY1 TaxID=2942483 RepID=UPI0028763458|nr:hypothetical protein [Clostridium sp. SHJSY1]MDS0526729.1 hypothetical protein [Clostridium sp. SHJSY1]
MEIVEIFKSPYKGEFCNSKLKIKESITIASILALVWGIINIFSVKILVGDLSRGIFGYIVGRLIDQMLLRAFILLVINYFGMILVFSAIIYVTSKVIFELKVTYEEILSICTYAAIIPTSITFISALVSLFNTSLSVIIIIIQMIILIILTYEGLTSVIIKGKSKVIYSVAGTYIINLVLFGIIDYIFIKSMIESSLGRYFW